VHYSYTNTSITDMYAVCICMQPNLFTFAQLKVKQLPKLFDLFVKQNSNTFLFDRKQFSEITIVRKPKRV